MIRHLMVPLDGSPAAERALPWAAHLARRAGAAIHLARVASPPMPVINEGMGVAIPNPGLALALREGEASQLAKAAEEARAKYYGVSFSADLLDVDDTTAGTLAAYATDKRIDLVVMTTQGLKPFSRFLLGSVADDFLKIAPVPTLLLRADPDAAAAEPAIRKVLVPLDGSRWSERTLKPALAVADLFDVEIELFMVLDAVPDIMALIDRTSEALAERIEPHSALAAAKEYLTRLGDRLERTGRDVNVRVVEHGSAAETILAESEAAPDTLIALATHGRGGLSRMLFGSNSDKIIRGAAGPVLVVRPGE